MKVNLSEYDRGTFIKFIREWTGLTQKEFGEKIGKSLRTIQDYKAGRINYSIKTLEDISKKFDVSIIACKKS